jgi:hypothetical protein
MTNRALKLCLRKLDSDVLDSRRFSRNSKTIFDEPNAWSQIKFLSMYDSLHEEPRYKALVKRAGLQN